MSLTLEEVRQVRFRMARRGQSGYEVGDVDNFIDKVEETFAQFDNEREVMRREAESARNAGEGAPGGVAPEVVAAKDSEIANLRREIDQLNAALADGAQGGPQVEKLAQQNSQLRAQLDQTRAELDQARSQGGSPQVADQANTLTVATREDAAPAVIRLVQLATEQAESLVNEAELESARKLEEAKKQAFEITTDARTKADRVESEARVNAEQMTREAEQRAAAVDGEAARRRNELFAGLEREQGLLTQKVGALRNFESDFRENLRSYLSRNLNNLEAEHLEPGDAPELAQAAGGNSRLDSLARDYKG